MRGPISKADLAHARMAKAERQVVSLPDLAQARQLDDQVCQRTDGDADRQPLDAHDRRQEDRRQDDDEVVGERRQRRTVNCW